MKHNWEYKRLGDICSFERGVTYAKGDESEVPSNVVVLRSNNIDLETFSLNFNDLKYLKEDFIIKDSKKLRANSILICMSNGSLAHLGKTAFVAKNYNFAFGGFMGLIIPHNQNVKFISYIFRSHLYTKFLESLNRGANIRNLQFSKLSDLCIPVPPIEVQAQIVSELDALNGTIAKCRELLTTLDSLAQSLFYDTFTEFKETVPLSHYVVSLKGGKSLAGDEINENKVLKSGAVTYDYFDKYSTKYLPAEYEPMEDHKVNKGDLLISRMNTAELVGACAYVFDVEDNTYLPDRLWRIECSPNANAIFLWKSLISDQSKEQIRAKASGTSGSMKNISKPLLLTVMVKNVPLSIQENFARKIEAIEAEKKKVEATMAEVQTLLDSRMDYWFN